MAYDVKVQSGKIRFFTRDYISSDTYVEFYYYLYFRQMYDVELDRSKFIVDKVLGSSSDNIFDGKFQINGKVVFSAKQSSKNAVIDESDGRPVFMEFHGLYNNGEPILSKFYQFVNADGKPITFEYETDHNENGAAELTFAILGNTSSSAYFYDTYPGVSSPKTYIVKNEYDVILDNGLTYVKRSDTSEHLRDAIKNLPIEYYYYGNNYLFPEPGSWQVMFENDKIVLCRPIIQSIKNYFDVDAGCQEEMDITAYDSYSSIYEKIKDYIAKYPSLNQSQHIITEDCYSYSVEISIGNWKKEYYLDSSNAILEEGVPSKFASKIPIEVLYQMATTPREKARAVLKTYLSNDWTNFVGDSEPVYFYVSVPSDVIPSITDSSATVVFANEDYNIGEAIAEYSYVNLLASAEGIYGSSIEKFIIQGAYNTEVAESNLNYAGDIIKTQGLKEFTIIAVDSRGMRSESKQYFIQFYKYDKPKILTFDVGRVTGDETSIAVRPGWQITSINGKNSSVGTIKFKKKNETAWRTLCEIANNSTEYVLIANPDDADGLWDKYYSYEFMLVVQDLTKNYAESIKFVPTIKTIMDFKEPETKEGIGGVGIGKTCELENFVEIWLNAKLYNDVYIGDDTLAEYIAKTMRIQVSNVVISKDDFEEYYPVLSSEYPYRIAVPIDGVNSEMMPEVLFSFDDSRDGNFAQFSDTYDGGVYLYANAIPSASVTIPYIICRR